MKSRRAFLLEPRKFELKEVDVSIGSGQIMVKVAVCGLCNWEMNHWKGLIGEFPQSVGHEWAGTVVEVGEGISDVVVGDKVTGFADGLTGFSDYVTSTKGNYFKLDSGIILEEALGEPLKCIVTVIRAAEPEAGDIGVVMGCGPMGLWCVQGLSGNLMHEIIAVDIDESKLELAKQFGATHLLNPTKVDVEKSIEEISKGRMADFVIEGTGSPAILNQCVNYLKKGRGRLVLMSSHSAPSKEFDFRPLIEKSVELRVAHPDYAINQLEDFRRTVELLNKGTFKMNGIISHVWSLEDVQEAFETCEKKPNGYLKGVVRL